MRILITILSICLLSACSTTYRQPAASDLAENDLAILEVEFCPNTQCLILGKIDDVSRGIGTYSIYQLKPGTRRVEFTYAGVLAASKEPIILEFDAQRGVKYKAVLNIDRPGRRWGVQVVEAASGRTVARVANPQ